jgi:hypothetical protein
MQAMGLREMRGGGLIERLDWRRILPFESSASSDRLGWVGLAAAHCRAEPAFELNQPPLTHHKLVLYTIGFTLAARV